MSQNFAEKATEAMDEFIESNNLSENEILSWANEHFRISAKDLIDLELIKATRSEPAISFEDNLNK